MCPHVCACVWHKFVIILISIWLLVFKCLKLNTLRYMLLERRCHAVRNAHGPTHRPYIEMHKTIVHINPYTHMHTRERAYEQGLLLKRCSWLEVVDIFIMLYGASFVCILMLFMNLGVSRAWTLHIKCASLASLTPVGPSANE